MQRIEICFVNCVPLKGMSSYYDRASCSLKRPQPPPPPELLKALEELQKEYPDDAFEAIMRLTAVSDETGEPISLKGGSAQPPNVSWYFYPRVRCNDCPGRLYTPDDNLGSSNFEVHLKNKGHKLKVNERLENERARNRD